MYHGSSWVLIKSNVVDSIIIIFFLDFIYLFMTDTQREAETQAEGEAGSMQDA